MRPRRCWRGAGLVLALVALAACAAPAPVVVGCPALKSWSRDEQQQLKRALAALPAGSILRPAIFDYARMRDEARACRPPPKRASPWRFLS